MSIYDRLHEDHERAKETIDRIKDTTEDAREVRGSLFAQLKNDLQVHTQFENQVFYPAVAENPQAKDLVEDGIDEHEDAEALLEELDEGDKGSLDWIDRLEQLEDVLLHHIEDEENEIFKFARETISAAQAKEMAEQYERQKQEGLRQAV